MTSSYTDLPLSSEGGPDRQEGVGAGLSREEEETASQEVSAHRQGGGYMPARK